MPTQRLAQPLFGAIGALIFLVTLPLSLPGILAGSVLCFAKALGEFGATITFVSNSPGQTQTISAAIYTYTQVPGGVHASGHLLDTYLFAHSRNGDGVMFHGNISQIGTHQTRLDLQVQQQGIQHRTAQHQSAIQRPVDAHVEPGFDAFRQKLHRNRVHQGTGQHRDHGKHHQQAKCQQGTKDLSAALACQHPQGL